MLNKGQSLNIKRKNKNRYFLHFFVYLTLTLTFLINQVAARDLAEIKKAGVLQHIGADYANFVSYHLQGDTMVPRGLDVELVQGFARHLGVKYQFVPAKQWTDLWGLLTGQNAKFNGEKVIYTDKVPIQGDVIASGVTNLAWRQEMMDFSDDYFLSGIWLITSADSDLQPIQPSGSLAQDIMQVKSLLRDRSIQTVRQTCLDPDLYNLQATGAKIVFYPLDNPVNGYVPAILKKEVDSALIEVSDALIALQKWPGKMKVIGPVSEIQVLGAAFRKSSPELRKAFNAYLKQIRADGSYNRMVGKYYPAVFDYYGEFFNTDRRDVN